jgi:hypothetical protein
MIEGAGLEVPDLVGVVEEAVAHQLSLGRRQPYQVHLLAHTQFEIQIKHHAICFDQMNRNRNRRGAAGAHGRRAKLFEKNTHLVLLLEAERPGEEGRRAGLGADVGDAPRLQAGVAKGEEEEEEQGSRRRARELAWYLRPP